MQRYKNSCWHTLLQLGGMFRGATCCPHTSPQTPLGTWWWMPCSQTQRAKQMPSAARISPTFAALQPSAAVRRGFDWK